VPNYLAKGFHSLTPHLVITGAAKAVEWYQKALGAEVLGMSPMPDGRLMHATLRFGDSMLMLGKARDEWHPRPAGFYLYVPDCDAVYKKALAAGATTTQEPTNHDYGDRGAGVRDSQGNDWWIGTHIEDVSPEELERRMKAGAH